MRKLGIIGSVTWPKSVLSVLWRLNVNPSQSDPRAHGAPAFFATQKAMDLNGGYLSGVRDSLENMMKAAAMAFLSEGIHTCLVLRLRAPIPRHMTRLSRYPQKQHPRQNATGQNVPLPPWTSQTHPVMLFVRSPFMMKAKEREQMACGRGPMVSVRDAIATTNVASQRTSNPRLACFLGAFEELVRWQRR